MSNNGPNWYPSKNYVDHRPARPTGAPSGGSSEPGNARPEGPIRRLIGKFTRQSPAAGKGQGGVDR